MTDPEIEAAYQRDCEEYHPEAVVGYIAVLVIGLGLAIAITAAILL